MQKSYQILDAQLNPVSEIDLSRNRAFLFGDGFFETIRIGEDGSIPLWSFHWDRIQKSRIALQLDWPDNWTERAIFNLLFPKLEPENRLSFRVKLLFFRQAEGAYSPNENTCRIYLERQPLNQPWLQNLKESPQLADSLYYQPHSLSWMKSISSIVYVKAGLERKQRALEELIICDKNGHLIEGSYSFLCWGKNGVVYLPDRSLGGIESVCRKFHENYWVQHAIPFQSIKAGQDVLQLADWIAFGNALGVKIWPNYDLAAAYFPSVS